jgi:SWI/SNF-related matrix-associated actin-dependent regulator 1 of chromatin subfamily A
VGFEGRRPPITQASFGLFLYSFGVTPLTYQAFIDRYCNGFDSGFGYQITGTKAERVPELKAMLSRVMLRRRKQDVLADLPPIFYSRTVVEAGHVEIGPEIDRLKREERRLADAMALAESSVDEAMAALEGLAQSLSTLRRYSGLRKVAPVVEMISGELELGLYDKVVIFAIHKDVVAGLRHGLAAFNPVVVDGGTPIAVSKPQSMPFRLTSAFRSSSATSRQRART